MTRGPTSTEELDKISFRIGDCAHAALAIDLIAVDNSADASKRRAAISGIASMLEAELNRISEQIEGLAVAKGPQDAVKPSS